MGFGYGMDGHEPREFHVKMLFLGRAHSPLHLPLITGYIQAVDIDVPIDLSPDIRVPAARRGLDVQGWFNRTLLILNGRPLTLESYEQSRSLTIAPDGQGLVLGADWYLRRFDRAGTQVWQQPVPGTAWAVN